MNGNSNIKKYYNMRALLVEKWCRLEGNNRFLEYYIDELLLVKHYWTATSTLVKLTLADYKSNILNS
jgi:hypothetical protein